MQNPNRKHKPLMAPFLFVARHSNTCLTYAGRRGGMVVLPRSPVLTLWQHTGALMSRRIDPSTGGLWVGGPRGRQHREFNTMADRVTHRAIGHIPGCKPAGVTPTLMQQLGMREKTPEQRIKEWRAWCADQYVEGRTRTTYGLTD